MEVPEAHTQVEQGRVAPAGRVPRATTVTIPGTEAVLAAVLRNVARLPIGAAAPTETTVPEVPTAMEALTVAGRRAMVRAAVRQVARAASKRRPGAPGVPLGEVVPTPIATGATLLTQARRLVEVVPRP